MKALHREMWGFFIWDQFGFILWEQSEVTTVANAVCLVYPDCVYIHYLCVLWLWFRPYGGSLFSRARIAGPEKSNHGPVT
jgi:hypothetical protein